jgi:nicotinate phosphoribosyltransferase
MLFVDQYQLTMAQLYFEEGLHERPARFDYFFRSYPDYGRHQAGYCVSAGLGWLLEWMARARFGPAEIDQLRSHRASTGAALFSTVFLEWLEAAGDFTGLEMAAVPEGRVVHPHAPAAVVQGPFAMAQILETSLLNHLNYQTLIATKASRVSAAGRGRPVLDFGMRRGPAVGANAGSRAALIGGCNFSSNVGLSHHVGLPPKGTHAHSMVQAYMAFGGGELEAFRAFARAYPDDCILLVDTIDTLDSGIPNAITVFGELRAAGHEPVGVRLDSGDLAYLAIRSAQQLDAAGFGDCAIVLSSNLDELAIWQILSQIEQEAGSYGVDAAALIGRLMYGVGTRLITSQGDSALDGVYKLVAVQDASAAWVPAIKVSDSPSKIPTPGEKSLWRVYDRRGFATADVIATATEDLTAFDTKVIHHPHEDDTSRVLSGAEVSKAEPLLEQVWRGGPVGRPADIGEMRARREADLARLDPGVRRLVNPHVYHVSLTDDMKRLQRRLVAEARGRSGR